MSTQFRERNKPIYLSRRLHCRWFRNECEWNRNRDNRSKFFAVPLRSALSLFPFNYTKLVLCKVPTKIFPNQQRTLWHIALFQAAGTLFCFTQRSVAVICRRFGTTYRSCLEGSIITLDWLSLRAVITNQSNLCNIPQEWIPLGNLFY